VTLNLVCAGHLSIILYKLIRIALYGGNLMEHIGFTILENRVAIGDKEYVVRNCTPKLTQSEYESKRKLSNDKLYVIFSKIQHFNFCAMML
jgi:hypothetical protein